MPELKAIFWDNDGVLVDTEPLYFQANRETLREIDFELSLEEYVELSLVQGKGVWTLLERHGIARERMEPLQAKRNARYSRLIESDARLMEGIAGVLARCAERFRMGVVTSSRKEHFDALHRESNLLHHFEFVLTGEDYTRFKPDPQPYQMALEKVGLHPDECVVIEDTERGLEAARAAGMRCLLLPSALAGPREYPRAHTVLKDVREIPDLLAGM